MLMGWIGSMPEFRASKPRSLHQTNKWPICSRVSSTIGHSKGLLHIILAQTFPPFMFPPRPPPHQKSFCFHLLLVGSSFQFGIIFSSLIHWPRTTKTFHNLLIFQPENSASASQKGQRETKKLQKCSFEDLINMVLYTFRWIYNSSEKSCTLLVMKILFYFIFCQSLNVIHKQSSKFEAYWSKCTSAKTLLHTYTYSPNLWRVTNAVFGRVF